MIIKNNPDQGILIVGTGYVGLITAVGLADLGHNVTCYDINNANIEKLKNGVSPIFEPGVADLLVKGLNNHKLSFYDSLKNAYKGQRYIFVCVQTPTDDSGKSDLSALNAAITTIAETVTKEALIVVKSTVPLGSFDSLQNLNAVKTNKHITFLSCPEFLAEGSAVRNFFNPMRTIVGSENDAFSHEVAGLFYGLGGSYIITNAMTAQMIKYSSNSFLATRVAFINDIAEICEKLGINANDVSQGMTIDPRLGGSHLMPGMSFCGPCLPKDIAALIESSEQLGAPALLLRGAQDHNESHIRHVIDTILNLVKEGDTVAIFGLSFKPNTDDVRNAFSSRIIRSLIFEKGTKVRASDPRSIAAAKRMMAEDPALSFHEDPIEAAKGSDLQLFLTPWEEYTTIDFTKLAKTVNKKVIYDTMQMVNEAAARAAGFSYQAVGRHYGEVGSPTFELSENPVD